MLLMSSVYKTIHRESFKPKCHLFDNKTSTSEGSAMSDWDFLHEMRDRGYSADDIALAAGVGYAPWEEVHISRQWIEEELKTSHRTPLNRCSRRSGSRAAPRRPPH
jgi:hypothetical protein